MKSESLVESIIVYLSQYLDTSLSAKDMKEKTQQYYSDHLEHISNDDKAQYVEELESYNVLNMMHNIDNHPKYSREQMATLIPSLAICKEELLKKLTEHLPYSLYRDYGDLERKVSPPVKAYDYVGNCILDVTPTGRSYGTLFE